jgi:molybdopterin converting factor small subunit
MVVTVKLFAHFRNGRFKEAIQDLPPGTVCGQVLESLGLTDADAGITLVNGRHANLDHELLDQDTLSLFPLVGGG